MEILRKWEKLEPKDGECFSPRTGYIRAFYGLGIQLLRMEGYFICSEAPTQTKEPTTFMLSPSVRDA